MSVVLAELGWEVILDYNPTSPAKDEILGRKGVPGSPQVVPTRRLALPRCSHGEGGTKFGRRNPEYAGVSAGEIT